MMHTGGTWVERCRFCGWEASTTESGEIRCCRCYRTWLPINVFLYTPLLGLLSSAFGQASYLKHINGKING